VKTLRNILIFALMIYVTNWLCNQLLWLEFHMKPYTPLGKTIFTYGQHVLFVIVALVLTVQISVALDKRGRKT
jgi:hypothetical protein